jgi:hypothetical protein
VSRTASLVDIINGALGIAAAIVGIELRRRPGTRALKIVYGVVVAAIMLFVLRPVYSYWEAIHWQRTSQPVLATFERAFEMHLWRANEDEGRAPAVLSRSGEQASEGTYSLKVATHDHRWNPIRLWTSDMNLAQAEAIAFDFYNPGTYSRVELWVKDLRRTVVRRWLPVAPAWNHLQMPMAELDKNDRGVVLDRSRIQYIRFSTSPDDPAGVYYLDNLRLIPRPAAAR